MTLLKRLQADAVAKFETQIRVQYINQTDLENIIANTVTAVLDEERERTQKNFSLAVHNTCRKHKPEELKALTTLLNEPCLEALTPLPDKE